MWFELFLILVSKKSHSLENFTYLLASCLRKCDICVIHTWLSLEMILLHMHKKCIYRTAYSLCSYLSHSFFSRYPRPHSYFFNRYHIWKIPSPYTPHVPIFWARTSQFKIKNTQRNNCATRVDSVPYTFVTHARYENTNLIQTFFT